MNRRPEIPEDITHAGYFDRLLKDRVNRSAIPNMSGLNTIIQFEISDNRNQMRNIIVENGVIGEVKKEMCY